MSFLDRLKSFFSSGSGAPEDIVGRSADDPRMSGPPPTPVDPLGSPAPEAAPDPVTPPPPPPSDPDKL